MTSNIAQGRERVCIEQTGITRMRLTSGYTPIGTMGTNVTIQEQTHGGHKAWQSLNLERQA